MHRIGTYTLQLAALLALALAANAGVARAGTGDGDPLGEVPALGEYIEEVPTAKGPTPTSTPTRRKATPQRGRTKPPPPPPPAALPPAAEKQLAAQPKAVSVRLRKITSSPHYGASARARPAARARARQVLRSDSDAQDAPRAQAFGTVLTAATTGGDAHLTVLLVIVLLATAAAVAVAVQRALGSRRR
jgi:hypothetical protein